MKLLSKIVAAVTAMTLLPAAANAQLGDAPVLSTPEVRKILGTPTFDGSDFYDAKSQALYCYYEENKQLTSDFIVEQVAAGADSLTKTPIEMNPSPCMDKFHAFAAQPRFNDGTGLFPREWTYQDVRGALIRYIASCIWERDTDAVRASIADLADYKGIGDHLRTKYRDGVYSAAGTACFAGFDAFEAYDLTFSYNLLQQLLLRRELD